MHHPAVALCSWRCWAAGTRESSSGAEELAKVSCLAKVMLWPSLVTAPFGPPLTNIIRTVLWGLLCSKRREMLRPAPRSRSPASPDTPLLPLLQLTYLPPPWGECRSSDMGLDFFPVYSITACRIDCETRYIVENCNCKMVHMPGQCAGGAGTPPSTQPGSLRVNELEQDQGLKELGIPFPNERRMLTTIAKCPEIGAGRGRGTRV